MLQTAHISVMNLENAMRGARNPLNSWARSDSYYAEDGNYVLGENDLSLATRLCSAGSDHRKFIRQILVCMDITAPLYWWKEFDTYKVGTVANSTSTMHKLHAKPFELSDFSVDHLTPPSLAEFEKYMAYMEGIRRRFVADISFSCFPPATTRCAPSPSTTRCWSTSTSPAGVTSWTSGTPCATPFSPSPMPRNLS